MTEELRLRLHECDEHGFTVVGVWEHSCSEQCCDVCVFGIIPGNVNVKQLFAPRWPPKPVQLHSFHIFGRSGQCTPKFHPLCRFFRMETKKGLNE